MEKRVFNKIFAGLIFIAIYNFGHASPATNSVDSLGSFQNDDDYQYSDDEGAAASTKSTEANLTNAIIPFFKTNNVTVEAINGKDAVLECPVQNISDHNVVLWFKGKNALSNGPLVLNNNYTLNTTNFALHVLNATQDNQGEYYCEIMPQKINFLTKLIIKESSDENVVPDDSRSSQESVHSRVSALLSASSVIGIFLFLRIKP